MNRRLGGWLIAAGLVIDAAVVLLPLTPYPIIQMTFDRDYYDAQRGYDQFVRTGKWEAGDPGFALMRTHYMEDTARGLRPELVPDEMPGTSLITFQMAPEETPGMAPEKRTAYVVFSNKRGHIVQAEALKTLSGSFRKPYAMVVSAGLMLLGTVLIYFGLARATGIDEVEPNPLERAALSRPGGS